MTDTEILDKVIELFDQVGDYDSAIEFTRNVGPVLEQRQTGWRRYYSDSEEWREKNQDLLHALVKSRFR